jgi:cholesterol oxidase
MSNQFDYDVVVIGSGVGGSVAALRLTEKGYAVGVLEAGRRFEDDELPKTNWRVRKFFWAPKLGCTGIQRIHMLPDVLILAGAGVGGGQNPLAASQCNATSATSFQPLSIMREWPRPSKL